MGFWGEPLGHERFGSPRLERIVILGSEESESKTRTAGWLPLVGGGGFGKIRVPASHLVLVAGLSFVERGFPSSVPGPVAPAHDCASGSAMRPGSPA